LTLVVRTRRVVFAEARWHSFAEGLVNDLITQDAFDNAKQTTFEADLHLRAPLRRFAQEI